MKMKFIYKTTIGLFAVLSLFLIGCGGKKFEKTPIDKFIIAFDNEPEYSVILADMDVEGTFFKTYMHKYKVILVKDSLPYETLTDWQEVDSDFFWKNEENLGMTILAKDINGQISKVAAPPGYRYVGDSRYGEWRTHNGSSFWAFYGQYMFMSHMFGMIHRPVYRRDYNAYSSGGYYGRKNYYGPKQGKSNMYGTSSAQTKKSNPNFYQRRANKSGWSGSRSRSGGRSRGSGFGK